LLPFCLALCLNPLTPPSSHQQATVAACSASRGLLLSVDGAGLCSVLVYVSREQAASVNTYHLMFTSPTSQPRATDASGTMGLTTGLDSRQLIFFSQFHGGGIWGPPGISSSGSGGSFSRSRGDRSVREARSRMSEATFHPSIRAHGLVLSEAPVICCLVTRFLQKSIKARLRLKIFC